MREERSSRWTGLRKLGRIGVKSLIKEPVKEAVQEALAEEQEVAEEQVETTERQHEESEAGSRNRLLRPKLLLPILGIAAAGALARRWGLVKMGKEKAVIGQNGDEPSTHGSGE